MKTSSAVAPELVSFSRVCAKLGCNRATLQRLIETEPGFPRPFRLGGRRMFRASAIDDYIARASGLPVTPVSPAVHAAVAALVQALAAELTTR
jgi:predicted DNA-binding transcriptional regulator AlpA